MWRIGLHCLACDFHLDKSILDRLGLTRDARLR